MIKTKTNISLLIIFASLGTYCSDKKDKKAAQNVITDTDVYDDYDPFKLEGIKRIEKPTAYPYIKIDNIDSVTKRLVVKRSAIDSAEKIYKKQQNYWTTWYDGPMDTGTIRTYEYIAPSRIIELNYSGTYEKKDYHLDYVVLLEGNTEIGYSFYDVKGIVIDPDPSNFDIVRKQTHSAYTTSYTVEQGLLTRISSGVDKIEDTIIFSDTSCYMIGDRSWLYWRNVSMGKNVDCK